MKRRLERIDESIVRYMAQLETADRRGDAVPEAKVVRFKDKIVKLREEIARLNAIRAEMMKSEDKQISLTDPDRAFDGNERQGHRDALGSQRASRGRYQEPSHCGPRGDRTSARTAINCRILRSRREPRWASRRSMLWLIAVTTRAEEIRTCEGCGGSPSRYQSL